MSALLAAARRPTLGAALVLASVALAVPTLALEGPAGQQCPHAGQELQDDRGPLQVHRMTMPRSAWAAIVAAGAAAALPAAAPAGRRPEATTSQAVHVQASRQPTQYGELRFVQRTLTAQAGRVTFVFTNPATLGHNFAVRRGRRRLGVTPTISRGATKRLTLRLAAGRYTFFCAVPGHEAAGMKGTLVIRASG